MIVGQENLKLYISDFYKKLFGASVSNVVSMNEGPMGDILKLCPEET